jgi:hypothetical protein
MSIGDVCPKESEEPPQAQDQPSSSIQASPPTQDEDQAQDDIDEDQEDEPPQEEDNDQGGDEVDQDKEDDQGQRPPHPRVHQAILSHPVLEGKPNANHVRARISYSRTQQLHNMDIITQCSK